MRKIIFTIGLCVFFLSCAKEEEKCGVNDRFITNSEKIEFLKRGDCAYHLEHGDVIFLSKEECDCLKRKFNKK